MIAAVLSFFAGLMLGAVLCFMAVSAVVFGPRK